MARKKLKGTIKRIGDAKTVAVEVTSVHHHPRYRKRIRTSKVHLVHVEGAEPKIGDAVTIEETRPISARKHFRMIEIGGKPVAEAAPEKEVKEEPKSKRPAARRRKETKK